MNNQIEYGKPKKYKAKLTLELIEVDGDGERHTFDQTALLLDGRFGSHVCEDITPSLFSSLSKTDNSCEKGYDFNGPNGTRLEMKSLTKNGVSYIPSSMKGTGRKYDEPLYVETLDYNTGGYVQNDVSNHGEISFLFMDTAYLKYGGKDGGPLKGHGKNKDTDYIAEEYNTFMTNYNLLAKPQ